MAHNTPFTFIHISHFLDLDCGQVTLNFKLTIYTVVNKTQEIYKIASTASGLPLMYNDLIMAFFSFKSLVEPKHTPFPCLHLVTYVHMYSAERGPDLTSELAFD